MRIRNIFFEHHIRIFILYYFRKMNVVARLDNRVDELVDEYLKSLMSNYQSGSENTIRSIKSDLSRFLAYGHSKKNLSGRKFLQRVLFSST